MKRFLILFLLLLLIACQQKEEESKEILLKADREAPLGWVSLTIYSDSTFEFELTGLRGANKVYNGKVEIKKDSLYFTYQDSIPKTGSIAVYNGKVVAYVNGKYPEKVNISFTKLTNDIEFEIKKSPKEIKLKYKDFEVFYSQFISDSSFQLNRVKFPLKGSYQDYNGEIEWTKTDWSMMKWDVRDENIQEDSTSIFQTEDRFFFGTYCIDCGFSFEMEFMKLDGKWFLTYRQENNF